MTMRQGPRVSEVSPIFLGLTARLTGSQLCRKPRPCRSHEKTAGCKRASATFGSSAKRNARIALIATNTPARLANRVRTVPYESLRCSAALGTPTPDRLLAVAQAMRLGMSDTEIHTACRIDPWFLAQIPGIVQAEAEIRAKRLPVKAGAFRRRHDPDLTGICVGDRFGGTQRPIPPSASGACTWTLFASSDPMICSIPFTLIVCVPL